jgi:hypothetical protein
MRLNYVKLKYTLLGVFFVLSALMVAYDFFITKPRRECEAAQNWWNDKDRHCYTPIEITTITKRPKAQDTGSVATAPKPATQSTSSKP